MEWLVVDFTPKEKALRNIKTGDIFHADGHHGGSLICLATSITDSTINARTVTHQLEFTFDRRTGVGEDLKYSMKGTIDSVAPLPSDIHAALVGLDARFQRKLEGPPTDLEKRALRFVDDFYPAHPISP